MNFSKISCTRIFGLLALILFVFYVSGPVLYTGLELAVTGAEISDYNQLAVKTNSDTDYVENSFRVREELMNSANPFVSCMASHGILVAIPILFLFGIAPVVLLIDIIRAIFGNK